jgi:EAL domain-containing protein (putative c-di-GMP-specific phosphodiesterase class I)/CheY-like chemotaxis protein
MTNPTVAAQGTRKVLVIDDELAVVRVVGLLLERNGFAVDTASSARDGLELLKTNRYHAVLSDIIMPELSGVEFLRELRRYDLDVPVILMTAGPTLDSALDAIAYGAQQYLLKPVEPEALVQSVGRAAALGELARLKRTALASASKSSAEPMPFGDRATLEAILKRAFDSITVVFQPIVSVKNRSVLGYEALMRCDEGLFANYAQILVASERIGWRTTLSRTLFRRIGESIADIPDAALLFVNMHPLDAQEGMLLGSEAPLEPIAGSVVLEVSEHAPADQLLALARDADRLRGAGYRLAIDDLGTGPSGLAAFTRLSPAYAKLDRTLFAGLDRDPACAQVVRAMSALCAELKTPLIAEGVQTAGERDALTAIGIDLMQGNIFSKPAKGFETPLF